MSKLTQEEHTKLQDFIKAHNTLKMQIGDIELTKQGMIQRVKDLKAEYSSYEDILLEKYGKDSVINLETGEVSQKGDG